jgi:hypothetical protein
MSGLRLARGLQSSRPVEGQPAMNSRCERLRAASAAVAGAYASRLPSWAPAAPWRRQRAPEVSAHIGRRLPSEPEREPAWQGTPDVSTHVGSFLPWAIRQAWAAVLPPGETSAIPDAQPFSLTGKCSHRALAAMGRRNGGLPAGSRPREHTRRASAANRDGNGTRLAGTRPRGCPPRAVRCQGRIAIPSYESFTCGHRGRMATVRSALPDEQGEQRLPCQGRGVAHVSRRVARLSPKVARFDSSVARDDVLSSPPSPYPSRRQAMLVSSLVYVLPLEGRHAARED